MNKKIEERAVRKIQEILDHDYLQQYISVNDKEPSWDGFIYVHNSPSESKKTIIGRIPVQVKGNTTLNLEKDSFQIRVADLKNYLNDGGVIYFVVSQESYPTIKVYYELLTPNKIKMLLNNKAHQQSISIKLSVFPVEEIEILEILHDFFNKKEKEMSYKSDTLYYINDLTEKDFDDGGSILFQYTGQDYLSIFEKSESGDLGIYFQPGEEKAIPIPLVNKIKNLRLYEEEKVDVLIKDRLFYEGIIRERSSRNQVRIKFGKSFSFYVDAEKNQGKLDINMTLEINAIERDYKFLKFLKEHKSFTIFGTEIPLQLDEKLVKDFESLNENYTVLRNIVRMMEVLNIDGNYDLRSLDEIEMNNLLAYSDSVINGTELKIKRAKSHNTYFHLNSQFGILLYAAKTKEGWLFYNYFEDMKGIDIHELINKATAFNKIPPEMILKISNFDISYILSIHKRLIENEITINGLEFVLLKILSYYDLLKEKKPKQLIKTGIRVFAVIN